MWLPARCRRALRPLFFFTAFGVIYPVMAFGQFRPCGPEELTVVVPKNAKIYPETVLFSKKLNDHAIRVKCVLLSKMDGMFDGQDGAALYRTDHGDFEVLFLPPAKSFEKLEITEQRDGKRYSYSFKGLPNPWPANRIDSANRIYFLKHRNMLFGFSEKSLADTIEKIFQQ